MEQREFEEMMEREMRNKARRYAELNETAQMGQTVLAGSSLMEFFPVNEMLMDRGNYKIVYNRGIGGATIQQYEAFLEPCVLGLKPGKLFINIGSNDLNLPGDTVGNLITGYRRLLKRIMEALPECAITLLAYYPCMKETLAPPVPGRIPRTMENVKKANEQVELLAKELGLSFLNVNRAVSDPEGYLDPAIAMDDIHFSPNGYQRVLDLLEPLL